MIRSWRERGAAAVEMAIILPLLLLVIGGLVDFGRAYYSQVVISNAAREGARMVALGSSTADVNTRVDATIKPGGVSQLFGLGYTTTITSSCATPTPAGGSVQITIPKGNGSGQFHWLVLNVIPSLFGKTIPTPQLQATGNMRCNG